MGRVSTDVKKYIKRFLPEKRHFTGVDIGAEHIKVAEIEVNGGIPEVVALRMAPSPAGVWSDNLDEEGLVQSLKEVLNPNFREVITCIGGEKSVCRILRLPQMSEKELWSAVNFEIQKYVPFPAGQLVIRYVRLGRPAEGGDQGLQDLLVLAAPLTTIYQYHGIFSRAGYTLTGSRPAGLCPVADFWPEHSGDHGYSGHRGEDLSLCPAQGRSDQVYPPAARGQRGPGGNLERAPAVPGILRGPGEYFGGKAPPEWPDQQSRRAA